MEGNVSLSDVVTVNLDDVDFITGDVCVLRSGNSVVFFDTHKNTKNIMSFELGQQLDCVCAQPARNGKKARLVVALHGLRTEIRVYEYPRKKLVQTLTANKDPTVSWGKMALSYDGEFLVSLAKDCSNRLALWNLSSGELATHVEQHDDLQWVSFNPFNKNLIATGHSKKVTVWNVAHRTRYQEPLLTPKHVAIDVGNKVERQILCHQWLENGRLLLSSRTGELLLCDCGEPDPSLEADGKPPRKGKGKEGASGEDARKERERAAKATREGKDGPVLHARLLKEAGVVGQPRGAAQSASATGWAADVGLRQDEEQRGEDLPCSVVASRLPLAAVEETEQARAGPWHLQRGAVVHALALTKEHVLAGTGDGSLLWLNKKNLRVVHMQRFDKSMGAGAAVVHVLLSPLGNALLTATRKGQLRLVRVVSEVPRSKDEGEADDDTLFETANLGTYTPQPPAGGMQVALLSRIPGATTFATATDDGSLRVWRVDGADKRLLAGLELGQPLTALTCSPDGNVIVCGLGSGVVALVDASRSQTTRALRVVFAAKLHEGPVRWAAYSHERNTLATRSTQRLIFTSASSFSLLGAVALPALLNANEAFTSSCWLAANQDTKIARCALGTSEGRVLVLSAPQRLAEGGVLMTRQAMNLVASATAVGEGGQLHGLVALCSDPSAAPGSGLLALSEDKQLLVMEVSPLGAVTVADAKPSFALKASAAQPAGVVSSLDGRAIAVSGSDGNLAILNSASKIKLGAVSLNSSRAGGVRCACFSPGSSHMLVAGCDGGLLVIETRYLFDQQQPTATQPDEADAAATVAAAATLQKLPSVEADKLEALSEDAAVDLQTEELQVLGVAVEEEQNVEEVEKKAVLKQQLLKKLEQFREVFDGVMKRNEEAPELEKLPLQDFSIDLAMRDELMEAGMNEVHRVREQVTKEVRGKELIARRIKKQCWEAMEYKGNQCRGFKADMTVHNFPVRRKSAAEKKRLEQVLMLRKMELLEGRWTANRDSEREAEREAGAQEGEEAPESSVFEARSLMSEAGYVVMNEYVDQKYKEGLQEAALEEERKAEEAEKEAKKKAKKDPEDEEEDGDEEKPQEKKKVEEKEEEEADEPDEIDGVTGFPPFLLYHPASCITTVRKRVQAVLLDCKLLRLQTKFNRRFEKTVDTKGGELLNISNKAKRIAAILEELQLDQHADNFRPQLHPEEVPESVLKVDPSEIKSQKVLSPEEQEEEDKRAAAEAERKAKMDDAPERALDDMMHGTLEKKRDLSLLQAQMTPPQWMTETAEEDMTEEQKEQVAAFEVRVEAIKEEQETRRKMLTAEMGKLKAEVAEAVRTFDARLAALFEWRVVTVREAYLLELMIFKLLAAVAYGEEAQAEERQLESQLERIVAAKSHSVAALDEMKKQAEAVNKAMDRAALEEKHAERAIKKDFGEVAGPNLEYLQKLWRAKRVFGATDKLTSEAIASMNNARRSSMGMGRRFSGQRRLSGQGSRRGSKSNSRRGSRSNSKPGSRRGSLDGGAASKAAQSLMVKGMLKLGDELKGQGGLPPMAGQPDKGPVDLDPFRRGAPEPKGKFKEKRGKYPALNPEAMPEDLDPQVWAVFVDKRKMSWEKTRGLEEATENKKEMDSALAHLQALDQALEKERQVLLDRHTQSARNRAVAMLDTEVMLRLRQGNVELEEAPVVTDLAHCSMIDKEIVERLNQNICKVGAEKVEMLKSKTSSKTSINVLKWTKQTLDLEYQDALDLTTELQLLRVTKSLQVLIKMGGHDNQKAAELKRLDRKIDFVSQATKEKAYGKKLKMMEIKRKVRLTSRENDRLTATVKELEDAVKERMQISQIRDNESSDGDITANQRMKALVNRRKLVDLVKLQSQEIQFLRDQVETLRKRTFASFAVPKLTANPDQKDLARKQGVRAPHVSGENPFRPGAMVRAQTR